MRFLSINRIACLISLALLTAACREGFAISPTPSIVPKITPVLVIATSETTQTPALARTPTQRAATPTPKSAPTSTVSLQVCSPLEGYALNQIPSLVSNPFHAPPPGSDDPHAGVDLADRKPGSSVALAGRAVTAVLEGRIAAVVIDRFPFGNALIIETPLSNLPEDWVTRLNLPAPFTGPAPHTNLTCPPSSLPAWNSERRSLYLLYAHMQTAPQYKLNDPIACGQTIGSVGSSGNALNPHLHLEARVGPYGASFQSLSHYDNRATQAEMDAYCTWTVRGEFQLLDPLTILNP